MGQKKEAEPETAASKRSSISDEDHAFGFLREQAPISPVAWEKLFQDTDLKNRARIWLQSWIDSGLCMLDDNLRVVVVESDENC